MSGYNFFDSWSGNEEIVPDISRLVHCPFCGADYMESNITIVARFDSGYVGHLNCRECQNTIMASFAFTSEKNDRKSEKPFLIDVKMNEMIDFIKKGPVQDDDILDFYKNIKNFKGDFSEIIKNNKKSILKGSKNGRIQTDS
ncbi:hypothetical protein HYV44_02450 [Candidatus Microgenomates bacterium]|nr:hypothetical protein [Candidatus Microgenomates bacterium]